MNYLIISSIFVTRKVCDSIRVTDLEFGVQGLFNSWNSCNKGWYRCWMIELALHALLVISSNRILYWQGTMVIPLCLQPRGSSPTVGSPQAASGLLCMGWKCISRKRVLDGISQLIRRSCSRLLFYDWGATKCVDQWRISESAVFGANHRIWSRFGSIMRSSSFSKGCIFSSMCNWRIESWCVQAACSKFLRISWPKCSSLESTHMWILTKFTFSFTKERVIWFCKDVPSTFLMHMRYVCLTWSRFLIGSLFLIDIGQGLALRMDSKITGVTMRLDSKHKYLPCPLCPNSCCLICSLSARSLLAIPETRLL